MLFAWRYLDVLKTGVRTLLSLSIRQVLAVPVGVENYTLFLVRV